MRTRSIITLVSTLLGCAASHPANRHVPEGGALGGAGPEEGGAGGGGGSAGGGGGGAGGSGGVDAAGAGGKDASARADAAADPAGRDGAAPDRAGDNGTAVVWQNEGTIAPWGHQLKDPGCNLVEVTTPTYRGQSAIRHVVDYPSTVKLSVHCEVARDPVAVNGDDLYYGWAFMLGDDWPETYMRAAAISQLTGRGACWNQNDFIQLNGLQLTNNPGGGADSCNPMGSGRLVIAPAVSKGVWHRVVIHKIWKGDATGLFEMWFDGAKVASVNNITTGFGDNRAGYAWHVGVYAGIQQERTGSRTIYTDHYRIARTYAAADPTSWTGE
jgi:hypothetical protein